MIAFVAFDSIPVRDFNNVERDVATLLQSGVHHPTGIAVVGQVAEDTGLTITTVANDITIDPQASYAIIDFGTADPTSTYGAKISAQYTSSGDFYAVAAEPLSLDPPRRRYRTSVGNGYTKYQMIAGASANLNEGSRVLVVPVMGVKTLRLETAVDGFTGVAVRQMAGPMHPALTRDTKAYTGSYQAFSYDGSAYSAGQVIGGSIEMNVTGFYSPAWDLAVPAIRRIALGDYDATLTDFDIVIFDPTANGFADHDAFDSGYSEGALAWFEVRATPSTGQYALRDFGASGGKGVVLHGLDIQTDYMNGNGTAHSVCELNIIDRTGVTFSAPGTGYVEIGVEA